jgi:uncharacterized protein (TIGR02996 family)
MADQREAFLKTIIENPQDDTPRLVFADWLEEHGEHGEPERAEFIRLQCGLYHTDRHSREDELKRKWGIRWVHEDIGRQVGGRRSSFARGLLLTLQVSGAALLATRGQVFRRAPLLNLTVTAPELHPTLAQVLLDIPSCLRMLEVRVRHSALAAAGKLLLRRLGRRAIVIRCLPYDRPYLNSFYFDS